MAAMDVQPKYETLEIPVAGGMCVLEFTPGQRTGRDANTRPGLGFLLISDTAAFQQGGKHYSGSGVISRADALRLRNAIDLLLSHYPAEPA